jgi:outer membrane protein assembly factor BamA
LTYALKHIALLAICAALLPQVHANAQQVWTVSADHALLKSSLNNKRFTSKEATTQQIYTSYAKLLAQGFFDAQLDTTWRGSEVQCHLQEGRQYNEFNFLWSGNTTMLRLLRAQTLLKPISMGTEMERMLTYCENHGYPFASIAINQIVEDSTGFCVDAQFSEGPKITLDSLVIKSNEKIPSTFLSSYLNLKKGEDYDESKLLGLDKKMKEIPFLSVVRGTEVIFKNGKADYYLFVKKKKANSFNGILGIRPNEKTGGVFFTGDVEVKLLNALNKGEDFYFNWRRLQVQTQDLQMRAAVPFLFKLPLGLEGNLKIYRRDSTFTTLKTGLASTFQMGGGNVLKLQFEHNNIAKLGVLNTSADLANVNSTLYGLGMIYSKLDYKLNPRRGFATEWNAFAGKREVTEPGDGITSSSLPLYKFDWQAEVFLPLWKKQCVRIGTVGASYVTDKIYTNEMYRIGGLRTLRGFSEETIFATMWSVASVEYRYLFEENSAVYLFTDAAWYEKKSNSSYLTDTPIGYGAGVNFETKSGIFTFNYALGSEFNNPILVRNAKISFGFRNVF